MKKIYFICLFFLSVLFASFAHAQNPPLRVAAARFMPPFVLSGGNNILFGYDIAMMESICQSIQRDCQFDSMPFAQLIPALVNNQADVAVGAIAITSERARAVNFSPPYLPSHALFLTTSKFDNKEPFSLTVLENKTIGVEEGTVFNQEIVRMGVKNAKIIEYNSEEKLIEALIEGKVDFILLDAPGAHYWRIQSGGVLKSYGAAMPYAYGLGIAVNPANQLLLREINQALEKYLKSVKFKENYNKYFGGSRL